MKIALIVLTLSLGLPAWGQNFPETKVLAMMDSDVHKLLTENWQLSFLDESSWESYRRTYHFDSRIAFTILEQHHTFVRQQFIQNGRSELLRFALAHEAGHRNCWCNSEKLANVFAYEHR